MKPAEYFKHYRAVIVTDDRGRKKKEIRYYGDYYHVQLEKAAFRRKKWILSVASAILLILYLILSSRNVAINREGAASAFCVLMVFPLFFELLGAVSFLFSKGKMDEHEYRTSYRFALLGAGSVCFISILCGIVTLLAWIFQAHMTEPGGSILVMVCYVLMAVLSFIIKKFTESIPFEIEKGILSDDIEEGRGQNG